MRLCTAILCSLALAAAPAPMKSPMKPGKWQVTMQMVVPGIPENMKGASGGRTATYKYSGKYLGRCDAKKESQ